MTKIVKRLQPRKMFLGLHCIALALLHLLALVPIQMISALSVPKNYLDSLSPPSVISTLHDTANGNDSAQHRDAFGDDVVNVIPDEHHAKEHTMAGWAGYKDPKWGGYLENLSSGSTEATFEQGKQLDYGIDVRWGAEDYLSNLQT